MLAGISGQLGRARRIGAINSEVAVAVQGHGTRLLTGVGTDQKISSDSGEGSWVEVSRQLLHFPATALILRERNKRMLALIGEVMMEAGVFQRRMG